MGVGRAKDFAGAIRSPAPPAQPTGPPSRVPTLWRRVPREQQSRTAAGHRKCSKLPRNKLNSLARQRTFGLCRGLADLRRNWVVLRRGPRRTWNSRCGEETGAPGVACLEGSGLVGFWSGLSRIRAHFRRRLPSACTRRTPFSHSRRPLTPSFAETPFFAYAEATSEQSTLCLGVVWRSSGGSGPAFRTQTTLNKSARGAGVPGVTEIVVVAKNMNSSS